MRLGIWLDRLVVFSFGTLAPCARDSRDPRALGISDIICGTEVQYTRTNI